MKTPNIAESSVASITCCKETAKEPLAATSMRHFLPSFIVNGFFFVVVVFFESHLALIMFNVANYPGNAIKIF